MAGRNQHHIPQFLQKGFGVPPRSGKPKEIWTYAREAPAECGLIRVTAADFDFYSAPSQDGTLTLDDRITQTESDLALRVDALRHSPVGTIVDAMIAADLIMKLAPRAGHVRSALATGLMRFASNASVAFSDSNGLERMMGLHEEEPGELFRERVNDLLRNDTQVQAMGLPTQLLIRAAFYMAKESFEENTRAAIPRFQAVFQDWMANSADIAREGHIRALERLDGTEARRASMEALRWTIEDGPLGGAILPDCVVIVSASDGIASAFIFNEKDIELAIFPLSTSKLLIGRQAPQTPFDVYSFNEQAAACSHDFFLAHKKCKKFEALMPCIGGRPQEIFAKAIDRSFGAYIIPPADDVSSQAWQPTDLSTWREGQSEQLGFDIHSDCSDEATALAAGEIIRNLVSGLGRYLPLGRLDGLTFAADYAAALRAVDRGDVDLPLVQTIAPEIGVGIARTITVRRHGTVKGRIVVDGSVLALLVSDREEDYQFALHLLTRQLAGVALLDFAEHSLPGAMLSQIDYPLNVLLFPCADGAMQAYFSAYASAIFGNADEITALCRSLLIAALKQFKPTVEKARLAYRYHAQIDTLLNVAMSQVSHVITFTAELLGHCAALGESLLDEGGELAGLLAENNLTHWPASLHHDLERWRQRQGRWESLDEFFALSRHVERLLWAVGIFPWLSPDGPRIEVPLVFDAAALMVSHPELEALAAQQRADSTPH